MIAKVRKAIIVSFLTLIPKKDNSQVLDEYMPISLINSLYRILAKILPSRLKKVKYGLIFKYQSTFLARR